MPSRLLRYLALGDSYTIGESVPSGQRWPNLLYGRLHEAGIRVSKPRIIARTGWTTRDLLNALGEVELPGLFDLVSLLIGVNNQYQGLGLESFRTEFQSLLQFAISSAGGDPARVVVLSIPDWGSTPFADGRDRAKIRAEIEAFNLVKNMEAKLAGVHFVDITRGSGSMQSDPSWVADDGLHPSGKLYGIWTALVYPIALDILKV